MKKTPLLSTYRIQFNNNFTFADAEAIVPYLHDLGITHLYASPIFAAVAGSQHGYDCVDPTRLNPELKPERFEPLVAALHQRGMAMIVDIVPNHMGIDTNNNPWWNDVLANGRRSEFGDFFDIDFDHPPRPDMVGKVLLPTLGEAYGTVLDEGELKLTCERDAYAIAYYDRRFPIDPQTVGDIEKFDNPIEHFNSSAGRNDLHNLLEKQNYRLAHWTLSAREMNYRRFFDVSSLAALQMQRPGVFEAHHALLLKLIADGKVAAVRVDHPDGLYDPKAYFEQLQAAYKTATGDSESLYIAAEKILATDEPLPTDWPIAGTSGYDFLIHTNNLFVDSANEAAMTQAYQNFTGDKRDFESIARQSKLDILDNILAAELANLTRRLERIAAGDRVWRDISGHDLREALRQTITACDVYRSYITRDDVSEGDVAFVKRALEKVKQHAPLTNGAALELIEATLLRISAGDAALRDQQAQFAARFQQLTSPVTAKGIEDTAFYRYHRLISLSEVGGDPATFGRPPADLHAYFTDRQKHWPGAMSTLSTHDTKRSEDVRARINVLSEVPQEWAKAVTQWHAIAGEAAAGVERADAYLIYQTLVGAWVGSFDDDFKMRIAAYALKALREAKVRTSWVRPDAEYEKQVTRFLDGVFNSAAFYAAFEPFAQRVAHAGWINALAQTAIKFLAPGVPDTYQSTELWDLSLVDPDNRRPVDYALRQRLLAGGEPSSSRFESGAIKLDLSRRLLALRTRHAELFLRGDYLPLRAEGPRSKNVFAFARRHDRRVVVAIVPRLAAALFEVSADAAEANAAAWQDTHIVLGDFSELTDVFTGQPVAPVAHSVAALLTRLPLAVLISS